MPEFNHLPVKEYLARVPWLLPVILAAWESEIRMASEFDASWANISHL
jgi:hypothetical protein